MREIKFRAWLKKFNDIQHVDNINFADDMRIELDDEISPYEKYAYIEDYVLMQYTGLKDKNGKDIYEGDIIQFTWDSDSCWGKSGTYLGYIRFDRGAFEVVYIGKVRERRFREGTECFDDLKPFMDWSVEVKVIANIYERPELLESDK